MDDTLVVVVVRTDQPNMVQRLRVIMAACEPVAQAPQHTAVVWGRPMGDVALADVAALAALLHPDDMARLGLA